jgi:toxin-antitoxin system PIN domain toxin
MIAVDTNLLVYAHRTSTPHHAGAKRSVSAAAADSRGWGFTLTNLLEFWSVVTHPAAAGRPSTPVEASSFVRVLVRDGNARIWSPAEGLAQRLTTLATEMKVSGPRIFDLAIALTAVEAGATELWTHDVGFVALPRLRLRFPLLDLP